MCVYILADLTIFYDYNNLKYENNQSVTTL